jgi:hypothetical protein
VAAKVGAVAALIGIPGYGWWYLPTSPVLPEKIIIDSFSISRRLIERISDRAYLLYLGSVLAAFAGQKKKGIRKWERRELSTKWYKFPYTHNPLKAFYRSLKVTRYLSKIWDWLPHYRKVEREEDIHKILGEIGPKLDGKVSPKEKEFTLGVIEEILSDSLASGRKDVYVKGLFIPYFYLNGKALICDKQSRNQILVKE